MGDGVNKNVKSDSFVKKLGNDGNSGKMVVTEEILIGKLKIVVVQR